MTLAGFLLCNLFIAALSGAKVEICNWNLLMPFQESQCQFQISDLDLSYNSKLLSSLSDLNQKTRFDNLLVAIKNNTFLIIGNIGSGSEGVVYLARDSTGNQVILKAIIYSEDSEFHYDNEVYALEKLARLLCSDEDHLIIVQKKTYGTEFGQILASYSNERAGKQDYPSNYKADHLKQRFLDILWEFRNDTQMVHNDYRPHNIIGDTVIDFSRSEVLSSDLLERQKQLEEDDATAEDEWNWYYNDADFYAIEQNPFLPNATERAYDLWEMYLSRYSYDLDSITRFRAAWLIVFHYILKTNDTETLQFPTNDDFN